MPFSGNCRFVGSGEELIGRTGPVRAECGYIEVTAGKGTELLAELQCEKKILAHAYPTFRCIEDGRRTGRVVPVEFGGLGFDLPFRHLAKMPGFHRVRTDEKQFQTRMHCRNLAVRYGRLRILRTMGEINQSSRRTSTVIT